jgi:hypothetical protein
VLVLLTVLLVTFCLGTPVGPNPLQYNNTGTVILPRIAKVDLQEVECGDMDWIELA